MPTLWPFAPRSELIEAISWRTDVLRTKASEQRLCLRDIPRREFSLSHIASQADSALARQLMRGDGDWLLPDWTQIRSAPAYTGAPVSLPDGPVVIWLDARTNEMTTVTSSTLGTVLTPRSVARIMPVLTARLIDAWQQSRPAGPWAEMSATFETALGPDLAAPLYPQYAGHDFVNVRNVIGSAAFTESLQWPVETVDNDFGRPKDIRTRDLADVRYAMRWHSLTDAAAADVRSWIYSRRGRWKAFWLPSWAHDMRKLSGDGASLTVDQHDPHETHIAALIGGVLYPRRVASAPGTSLTLDSALPAGPVERLSYLRLVRFDADRVEFRHAAGAGVAVSVPCVEVPA